MHARLSSASILAGIAWAMPFFALATTASDPPRFQLVGEAKLSFDQQVQSNGYLRLNAMLTPGDATSVASASAQDGGSFTLIASLAASAMACYNDTIFRDGFDGTGL
ncbi:MAG: hypothetical protein P4L92_20210 [Rudaea sp.]|nr:hypothetical protein [Rudaea sp.]